MTKPYSEWNHSNKPLEEYLQIEDMVDGEFVDYFLSNRPIINSASIIQMGEPCDIFAGKPIYDTLYRENDISPWTYMSKRIYVCSRYRADTEDGKAFNVAVAKYFSREIANDGAIPVTPHIYFPQFMDDDNEVERAYAMEVGRQMIDTCQTFVIIIIDGKISDGMRDEIEYMTSIKMMKGQQISVSLLQMEEMMKAVR